MTDGPGACILGTKRTLADAPTNKSLPKNYTFNFVSKLPSQQKLFDLPTGRSAWTMSTTPISQRFQRRTRKQRPISLIDHTMEPITVVDGPQPIYTRHRDISLTMLTYLQFAFNFIIVSTLLYVFIQMALTVRHDFQLKLDEHSRALLQEIAQCGRSYRINQCNPDTRVPALEQDCTRWELCMHRSPMVTARAKVSAETIAEIINSFVEPISYKTLFFFTLLTTSSLTVSNLAFGLCRRRGRRRDQL